MNPDSEKTEQAVSDSFAAHWYAGWIEAWNSHEPERVARLVTDDFILETPTTRHTRWHVAGPQAIADYMTYVLGAYPDLVWEQIAPPMFSRGSARVAFSWRGRGHFSGTLTPPGIPGTGRPFEFIGLEVFDFRDGRACGLNVHYDLLGLLKQVGIYGSGAR